jgi:hypothetical protein
MSTPDETHHEPPNIHDEVAAKTGETPTAGDAHAVHDAHGAHDAHDAAHGPQAAAGSFIEEKSTQDSFLAFVIVPLALLGLIVMMFTIYTAPIEPEPTVHSTPQAPPVGEQVPPAPIIR